VSIRLIAVLAAAPVVFSAHAQTSWYLSGRVILDDGSAPPEPVSIQSVCNGAASLAGVTDSKGQFGIRLSASSNRAQQDAVGGIIDLSQSLAASTGGTQASSSSSSNSATGQDSTQQSTTEQARQSYLPSQRAERALDNCELQATMPGFWPVSVSLRNRKPLDSSPLGTLILRRAQSVEGRTVSVTTLAAPKAASAAYEKGRKALAQGKLEPAREQFEKAVRLYPQYAPAWSQLGQIHLKQKRLQDAARSFENAIQADPKYVPPYLGLAVVQLSQRQWEKLAATTAQALKLDAVDFPQAYYLNALGNFNAHQLEAAEKSARQAERLDRMHRWPQVWHVLGLILISRREYAGAAAQFREYLEIAPQAANAEEVRRLLARAESLGAVASEQ
jgi:tetratricopeptide (TPR) repeat protein